VIFSVAMTLSPAQNTGISSVPSVRHARWRDNRAPWLLATWLALPACSRPAQEPPSSTAPSAATPTTATPPASPTRTAPPAGQTGSVEGVVSFTGAIPPLRPVAIDAETARRPGCAEAASRYYADYFGVSAPGPMAEALVTVDAHSDAQLPARRRFAIFRDCSITPRVLVMSLEDTLVLRAETAQHHIPKVDGMGGTIAQLLQRSEDQEKTLTRPGRYILHSVTSPNWMQTPLLVTPNAFYDQTDRAGHFRIDHLPPGTYTIHAWFPNTAPVDASVTIRAGEVTRRDFSLTALPADQIRPNQPENTPAPPAGAAIP
jgi:hypothetical protein